MVDISITKMNTFGYPQWLSSMLGWLKLFYQLCFLWFWLFTVLENRDLTCEQRTKLFSRNAAARTYFGTFRSFISEVWITLKNETGNQKTTTGNKTKQPNTDKSRKRQHNCNIRPKQIHDQSRNVHNKLAVLCNCCHRTTTMQHYVHKRNR